MLRAWNKPVTFSPHHLATFPDVQIKYLPTFAPVWLRIPRKSLCACGDYFCIRHLLATWRLSAQDGARLLAVRHNLARWIYCNDDRASPLLSDALRSIWG